MASPFANAGLGQFGTESKYYADAEMPGWMQGLKNVGAVAIKNLMVPPPKTLAPIAPITPVAPVGASPAASLNQPMVNDLEHPELNAASQTNIFGKQ
jgi:hypothetical protein